MLRNINVRSEVFLKCMKRNVRSEVFLKCMNRNVCTLFKDLMDISDGVHGT